jgi:uncharacterized membrane protein
LIDDEVKAVALILIGVMAAVAVYPILAESRIVEPFSELGVLGPNGKLGDYPREISAGESFSLFLYVGNHEGRSEYYRVLVKLGNQNSNVSDAVALDAPVVASWDLLLPNESNSTIPITLSAPGVGFNQRLVFELHRFEPEAEVFVYHQRWNQIWMNVTAPSR